MVASTFAMAAIAKARACGIGYAGVFNSCHFGAAGYYAAMAADADMIGLAMANDTPSVTAPGAMGRVTGSNPIAYAVPTGSGPPILLDMATSTVAGEGGRRQRAGEVDPRGLGHRPRRPADDGPGRVPGRRRPDPDGRSQGLRAGLLIESLSAVLTGAAITRQVGTWAVGDPTVPTGHGAAFVAIDIGSMMPIDEFKRRVDSMARGSASRPGPKVRTGSICRERWSGNAGRELWLKGSSCRRMSDSPWPGWRGSWG